MLYTPNLQQHAACYQALQRDPRLPVPLQLHDVFWGLKLSACSSGHCLQAPTAVSVRSRQACSVVTPRYIDVCMQAVKVNSLGKVRHTCA